MPSVLGNTTLNTSVALASDLQNVPKSNAILYGNVDSSSTSTAFTATISGLTEYVDGTCVMLHNGVITSESGFTVDINNLGAKPCYNNMTNATRDTTIFNVNYTMLFVYSSSLDDGAGGWWIYRGYFKNDNTIGYQLRGNLSALTAADKGYRYRIWFTSVDGTKLVPANKSTSTNATASRTPNTRAIDPFGKIIYNSTNGSTAAGAALAVDTQWTRYTFPLGYSFNTTGAALVLTFPAPVYVKCTPVSSGGATLDGYVQALPTTEDGKIYIFLGIAYSATNVEMFDEHPVYYYASGAIRLWTNAQTYAPLASPEFTGTPTAPTAASGTNTTQVATTAFVQTAVSWKADANHTHSSIVSPDGNTSVTANDDGTATIENTTGLRATSQGGSIVQFENTMSELASGVSGGISFTFDEWNCTAPYSGSYSESGPSYYGPISGGPWLGDEYVQISTTSGIDAFYGNTTVENWTTIDAGGTTTKTVATTDQIPTVPDLDLSIVSGKLCVSFEE